MKAFRPIILAWLLLLGATLAMGLGAWWLLGREADRVEALAAGALARGAATVAENVDLLSEEIKLSVSDGLLTVRGTPRPRQSLAELVANNPFVRAGFYYRGADGVTAWYGERGDLPSPAEAGGGSPPWAVEVWGDLGAVERDAADYSAIFRRNYATPAAPGELSIKAAPTDVVEEAVAVQAEPASEPEAPPPDANEARAAPVAGPPPAQNLAVQQRAIVNKLKRDVRATLNANAGEEAAAPRGRSRPELRESSWIADEEAIVAGFAAAEPAEPAVRQGWTGVLVEGRRQWLNWVDVPASDDYLGAWLDRDALVAELAKTLNLSRTNGVRYALLDAEGRLVAGERGAVNSAPGYEPSASLAVGASLPGWKVTAYAENGFNPFGRGFRVLGGLAVAGLSLAILLGGSLLLWQAQRDAQEAQRKTTFVANVSHELKTPLTSIRMFAEMLADGRAGDEAKRQRYLQTMLNETQRLTRLVNNVLDFSRLERGKREFQGARLDVSETIESILDAHRDRLAGDGLRVDWVPPANPVEATLDRDALEQVLLNLLDNAVKYAAEGERAEVALASSPDGWRVAVRDFGPGVPPRERRQVFESFHRVDDRLTAERPGCGLGLSIAARLAAGMGGKLSLEENSPRGCCFILTVSHDA